MGSALVVALSAGAVAWLPDPLSEHPGGHIPATDRILWREEGIQTTVAVTEDPQGRRTLFLDGLHQADDSPIMLKLHRLIGHLPMLLHASPRRVLVVGLGGGVTAGAASQYPSSNVDIVELSSSVERAASWFDHVNNRVLVQPNVRRRVDDARNLLLLRKGQSYDVVTADIIQPTYAGSGNLYSREFFTLVRHSLAPRGLVLQWIGRRPDTHYKLIMRTFLSVFPHTTLWSNGMLMVGSVEPLHISQTAFEQQVANPTTRVALLQVGIKSFSDLLSLYSAGPDELRAFVGEGPMLSDDRPLLEYLGSLPVHELPPDLRKLNGDVRRHLE